ncbi:glycoside hydrolase family 75 protein [Streptomyces sp. NPDC003832]
MRAKSLTLAAVSAVLLAPTTFPDPVPAAGEVPVTRPPDEVRAADLLAKVRGCAEISRERYGSDDGDAPTVPVCGTREAVFWKGDLDIDCDGRPGARCNARTDPYFSDATAFTQSDGRYLDAEHLPYVVVPAPSHRWDYRDHGIGGGSVVALVYRDRVRYAVVGDVGPSDIIGEASYAAAEALGVHPDPHGGGTPSGVTYIVFKDTRVEPIEDAAAAERAGQRLAQGFLRGR